MKSKKLLSIAIGAGLLSVPFALTATGLLELPSRIKPELPAQVRGILTALSSKQTPGCDQNATSTPCSTSRSGGVPQNTQTIAKITDLPENRPLVHIYTDSDSGLSFKYPEGFQVIEGDNPHQKKLIEIGSVKGGGLILDFYGSANLASFQQTKKPQSLTDFQSSETRLPPSGYVDTVSYAKELTKGNVLSVLPNGIKVLAQTYEMRLFDANGNDVTDKECQECRPLKRYVLFKSPQSYVTIVPRMSAVLENRIIQSIEYK